MSSYFFDTSALIKRYHREPGSEWVMATCNSRIRSRIFISHVAYVESVAAFRRLGRINGYHHSFVETMIQSFRRDFALSDPARPKPRHVIIPVSSGILDLAASLCDTYWQARPAPLRSLDAIQLACGITASRLTTDTFQFVTSDIRLGSIVPAEGLATVNPMFTSPP